MTANERLQKIMAELSPDMQLEVVSYARYLLEKNASPADTSHPFLYYICPKCFAASSVRLQCHGHPMISCDANYPEDFKPPVYEDGAMKARAPRWFIVSISPQA